MENLSFNKVHAEETVEISICKVLDVEPINRNYIVEDHYYYYFEKNLSKDLIKV